MRIGVFLTSAIEIGSVYIEQTEQLARMLADRGHEVVFGGTDYGLMKVLAEGYKKNGGTKLTGVFAKDLMQVTKNYLKSPMLDEESIEADILTRKRRMMELSDGFIVFPGGYGTLEEIAVILAGRANKLYDKPIAVFNVNGYYNALLDLLRHMQQEKFTKLAPEEVACFLSEPKQLVDYLEKYQTKELTDKFVS